MGMETGMEARRRPRTGPEGGLGGEGPTQDPMDVMLDPEERGVVRTTPFWGLAVAFAVVAALVWGTIALVRHGDAAEERRREVAAAVGGFDEIARAAPLASPGTLRRLFRDWEGREGEWERREAGPGSGEDAAGWEARLAGRRRAARALAGRAVALLGDPALLAPIETAEIAAGLAGLLRAPGIGDADVPADARTVRALRGAVSRSVALISARRGADASTGELREAAAVAEVVARFVGDSLGLAVRTMGREAEATLAAREAAASGEGVGGGTGVGADALAAARRAFGVRLGGRLTAEPGDAEGGTAAGRGGGGGRGPGRGITEVSVGGEDARQLVIGGAGALGDLTGALAGVPQLWAQLERLGFREVLVRGNDGVRALPVGGAGAAADGRADHAGGGPDGRRARGTDGGGRTAPTP